MKKILTGMIFLVLLSGCVAHVTPEGTYLEPLPLSVIIGPPIAIAPPGHVFSRPLPPVVVVPDRHIYFHKSLYYYYWNDLWYYGEKERGPWHRLPREHYPKQYRQRDRDYRDRDNRDGDRDHRDRDDRDYRDRGRY